MKYIITKSYDIAIETAILFPVWMPHNNVQVSPVVSAGFCKISKNIEDKFVAQVWGEAVSLKIKSRPEDAQIIEMALNYKDSF